MTVEETDVVVHLNYLERAAALCASDVRVPLAHIASATVSSSPWTDAKWKGLAVSYALGTGLPFLITLGRTVSLASALCPRAPATGGRSRPSPSLALRTRRLASTSWPSR